MLHRNITLGFSLALLMGLGTQSASAQNGERWRERQARRAAAQQQKAEQKNKAGENGNGGE